jgi:hypothetical protein
MKYLPIILASMLILAAGCDKEKNTGSSGEITLTYKLYGSGPYYVMGYNFALAKMVGTLDSPGPDIVVIPKSSPDNTVVESAYLSSDNMRDSFTHNKSFDDLASAEAFFNSYLEVDDSGGYTGIAEDIQPYQVWTYRTADNKYVKMLILTVKKEIRNDTPYAETTLRFVYQPDGSRTFPQ